MLIFGVSSLAEFTFTVGWIQSPLSEALGLRCLYCPYWFDEIHREDAELCFPSKIATYLASVDPYSSMGRLIPRHSRFREMESGVYLQRSGAAGSQATLSRVFSDGALYAHISRSGRQAFDQNLTQNISPRRCVVSQV